MTTTTYHLERDGECIPADVVLVDGGVYIITDDGVGQTGTVHACIDGECR